MWLLFPPLYLQIIMGQYCFAAKEKHRNMTVCNVGVLRPSPFLIRVLLEMSGQSAVDLPEQAVTWPASRVTSGSGSVRAASCDVTPRITCQHLGAKQPRGSGGGREGVKGTTSKRLSSRGTWSLSEGLYVWPCELWQSRVTALIKHPAFPQSPDRHDRLQEPPLTFLRNLEGDYVWKWFLTACRWLIW